MGVSINRDTPKWVVDTGKPIKMDDDSVGTPHGNMETSI